MPQISLLNLLLNDYPAKNQREALVLEHLLRFCSENKDVAFGTEIAGDVGHITAQARIENQDGTKILLVFSAKEGRWKHPGEHIEQEPRQTAIEEARRALGRPSGSPDEVIFAVSERRIAEYWNTPDHTHFEITYRFVADEIDDLPRGARWFPTEEADEIIKAGQHLHE
jgi:hypothetical protein